MAHSKIFQIQSLPVPEDEYVTPDMIPEWFTRTIADYVMYESDRDACIKRLFDTPFGSICERDGNEITFKKDRSEFFRADFERFKKALNDLQWSSTFEDFCRYGKIPGILWGLNDSFCNKYDVYVYSEYDLIPLDEFVRVLDPSIAYFIGGVLDYHW